MFGLKLGISKPTFDQKLQKGRFWPNHGLGFSNMNPNMRFDISSVMSDMGQFEIRATKRTGYMMSYLYFIHIEETIYV